MPFAETGAQELLDRVHASGRLSLSERVADAAARSPHRDHARHPLVLAHRDRHARHPLGARRPAGGARRPGTALILRSTVAPGTTEFVAGYLAKHRGFDIGEDVFVAHAPERIAAGRFLEEIDTLPCIIGGVGARSGEVAGELFGVFDAPIVQTTPVQAELAKIWTNILRYTNFALPNLLMMDCERYAANVFEVIDLINRDYPRGGIAQPGLHRRDLPAQGLRLLRGALARARDAARRLPRQRVGAAVPARRRQAAPRARSPTARWRCSGSPSRPTPTTSATRSRTSSSACSSASWPTSCVHDPHVATPDRVASRTPSRAPRSSIVATNHSRVPRSRARSPRSPSAPRADCLVVDPWNCWGAGQVFAYASELAALGRELREPRAGHRRRRHDRRRRRQTPARRPRLRGARLRPAPGAPVDARGLRGAHRRPARARAGPRGDGRAAPT